MRLLRVFILTVAAMAVTVFYFYTDPTTSKYTLQCSIRQVWGIHCWGCGGQSAFHNVLHGNWLIALKQNALVFPFILLFALIYSGEVIGKSEIVYQTLRKRLMWISVLLLIIFFTIARNLYPYGLLRL
jgi:hypothetical protein